MEITPRELRDTEIHSEMRGYSRDEVNDLLEKAAAAIDASNERVTQLQDRLTSAQSEATRTRETEDILHRTLLLAQRAADEAVAEATAKSRQMLDDAEMSSRRLVADSEAEARRKGEAERRRLEQEIVELAGRRDTLLADVEALTRFEAEYRERMVRALETDLSALKTRPTTAPASKPETSDVEIPASITAPSVEPAPAEDTSAPMIAAPAAPAAPAVTAAPSVNAAYEAAAVESPAPAPIAEVPASVKEGSASNDIEAPQPAPAAPARPEAAGAVSAATSEVDVRTLFEQSHDSRDTARDQAPRDMVRDELGRDELRRDELRRESPESAPSGSARAAGLQPIDLAGSNAVDADVLDDDAFFATLRDAVHDEKPLGPRDEDDDETGENRFFDQDAERGSFRDVFRRRR
jgi:cell division septum initiation protein DivIVA